MTPERIEEIKKVSELYPRTPSSYVNELLAGLEESQQANSTLRNMTIDLSKDLAEAQQTIARYKEALNIAMTQNQSHEVFRSIQELTGEDKS